MNSWRILTGDVREKLSELPAGCVRTCVTSPPYWGLRDYGVSGQLGLENTPEAYVAAMVSVFAEVRRVLADDGTAWLNLGDCYNAYNGGAGPTSSISGGAATRERPKLESGFGLRFKGLKPKDLVGIPWRVAFGLQEDGWYLRSDIIWSKPNPMPESVKDRPTKSHEYIFLLSKAKAYYYDADAIAEAVSDSFANDSRHVTGSNDRNDKDGYAEAGAQNPKGPHSVFGKWAKEAPQSSGRRITENVARARAAGGPHDAPFGMTRNKRTVWTVTTKPFSDWTKTSRQVRVSWDESDGDTTRTTSPDCPVHGDQAVQAAKALCGERAGDRLTGNGRSDGDHVPAPPADCVPTDPRHEPDSPTQSSDSLPPSSAHVATGRSSRTSRTGRAPATTAPCSLSVQTSGSTGDTLTALGLIDSAEHRRESNTAAGFVSGETAIVAGEIPLRIGGKCSCAYYRTVTEEMSHFATFPETLIEPCILAGSAFGDTVLDPFTGSGTTGAVAIRHQRNFIGCELNPAYVQLARKRIGDVAPMFAQEVA